MKHLFLFLSFLLFSCTPSKEPQIAIVHHQHISDGHVHLMSPQLIALWKSMGIPFSKKEAFYSDIDTIMTTSGAEKINLISMAYVYSSQEFGGGTQNIIQKFREENDFLAYSKSKYKNRIKAFFGIDPLSEFALEEIKRCYNILKLDGIKIHHNASQVYLTEPEHLQKVKALFQYASDQKIPILMHFDNGHRKFGKTDVQILADSVLAKLDFVDIQIAHFGTSGGFSPKTKEVLDTFIALFNINHPIARQNIKFDISAVALDKDAEGVKQLTESEFIELAEYTRKIGFKRIVFGTDYPLYKSSEYLNILIKKLHLSDKEINQLLFKTS
ncbi:MAG: amidohydrolase family protein [Bacteroidetes Order II. Incertae sedis bacterium]|nr:amidohydrolase family protein [Bacteroidetes Order II. bacterium]